MNPITYTWIIDQLYVYPQADGYTDVVVTAVSSLVGTNGTQGSSVGGIQTTFSPPTDKFTPYAELTEDEVIGWVINTLGPAGVAQYESIIEQAINVPPPVPVPQPLPWSN
jgi:hypothetical protein